MIYRMEVLDTRNVSGVTGSIPGPPEMVPGVHREGPPGPRGSMGQKREGNQPKVVWCASHKRPKAQEGEKGGKPSRWWA